MHKGSCSACGMPTSFWQIRRSEHDTATGRTAISTLRATDEAVDGIGKAVVAGKSQIENGSEHGRPSDGDRPPRSSRGGNAEMENPSSEDAESIKRKCRHAKCKNPKSKGSKLYKLKKIIGTFGAEDAVS